MRNKILPYVAIGMISFSTMALVGCDIDRTEYLNPTEASLFKMCEKQTVRTNVSCESSYKGTLAKTTTLGDGVSPEDQPFSKQGLIFIIEDRAFKDKNPGMSSMNESWHKYTGKWLYSEPEASQVADLKRVDDTYVLSPQLYDELITAVKTCNRATVESMQFKAGSVLTKEQYDKVMSIVLECKDYQLQKAINEK